MEGNSDKTIKKIIELFGEPDVKEFADDINKAYKLTQRSKSLNCILSKYEKKQLNKEICNAILEDVISALLKDRRDFPLFMKIYMNTADDLNSDCLRKHFILKDSKPKKMEDDDTSNGYLKFTIDLSCLFSDDKFFHKFIKGMLKYFLLCFNNDYLNEFLEIKYFKNLEKSSEYTANIPLIVYSLDKMLLNMRRILSQESKVKLSLQEKNNEKMTKNKYRVLCVKAHAHQMKDVLDIYDKCENNNQIMSEIEELYKNKGEALELLALMDMIQEYIENEKSKTNKKDLEKSIALKNTELYSYSKDIQELKKNINTLLEKTKNLEAKDKNKSNEINSQKNEINILKQKVDFIEPIVISLISRKVINYSICKILDKYKKVISITVKYNEKNEPRYDISFIDSVNKIKKDEANNFLNTLFERKALFNEDSHLERKELPSFITNIWELVKKSLNLEKKN